MSKAKRLLNSIKDIGNTISNANIAAFAGEATLFIIISFFPFTMILLMIMRYTPLTADTLIEMFSDIVPNTATDTVTSIVDNIYTVSSGAAISISAVTLIWSASRGFLSLVRGFNSVYQVNENRNYLKLRISSIFYTLCLALLIMFTLVLLVFGNKIFSFLTTHFPSVHNLALLIVSIRVIVSMGLYIFFFLILYMVLPNRKSSIIYELPGAILSSLGWLGFSYIYSIYVDNFNNSFSMYGSLSTIVLLMIWLYFCMNILFTGAQINQMIRNFLENHFKMRKEKKEQSL